LYAARDGLTAERIQRQGASRRPDTVELSVGVDLDGLRKAACEGDAAVKAHEQRLLC
jgi:hypothetical protein